jgi:hypothetical protein
LASDFAVAKRNRRARYKYAALIGAVNAGLFILVMLIKYGMDGESYWVLPAIFGIIWVPTFAAGLVFWLKINRTFFRMSGLSCLAALAAWGAIFVGQTVYYRQISLYGLLDALQNLLGIAAETYGVPYIGVILASWLFTTKKVNEAELF